MRSCLLLLNNIYKVLVGRTWSFFLNLKKSNPGPAPAPARLLDTWANRLKQNLRGGQKQPPLGKNAGAKENA